MATTFHAPHPRNEIGPLADGKRGVVAVPYIGKSGSKILNLATGSVLVTCFTPEAVKAGQVDPKEILAFIRRGVRVHSYSYLHAKVYVFGKTAFVGSANLSKNSQNLAEACVKTTDKKVVEAAKNFVLGLTGNPVTPEEAKSLIPLYPKSGERMFGVTRGKEKSGLKNPRSRLWICPVIDDDYDEVEQAEVVEGKRIAKVRMNDSSLPKLDQIVYEERTNISEGDWLSQRWKNGRGFNFECPAKVIYIRPIKGRPGSIIYMAKPKNMKKVSSSVARSRIGEDAASLTYTSESDRLIRASNVDIKFRRLWGYFR